jgi:hypothetical protein
VPGRQCLGGGIETIVERMLGFRGRKWSEKDIDIANFERHDA